MSDVGPRTVPPPAGALDDGALEDGALEDAPEVGVLALGADPVADGVELPALSLLPQAARIGALAPAKATTAAQRSTALRSRRPSVAAFAAVPSCCGVVGGAIVSSLMNLDLQEPAGRSS
jgi:hypothetical protein